MMNDKCKSCGSCGMPMEKTEDYGASDINNQYCVHCTDDQGSLTATLESVISYYTNEFKTKQGLDESAAREMATQTVSKLPAWST